MALLRSGRRIATLAVAVAVASSTSVSAQSPAPERPKLPSGRDANDWEAYLDYGVEMLRMRPGAAEAAFYWAGRLNPERAEPPFWQWVAFHCRDIGRFEGYLREEERVLKRPDVRQVDSLRYRSLLRNPLLPQGGVAIAYDQLPGNWGRDDVTHAWLAYAGADFARASELFGKAIARDPKRYRWLRYQRASALVMLGQLAGAKQELESLRESLAGEEKQKVVRIYESRELLDYALALIALSRGSGTEGRQRLAEALVENLSFAPAHAKLGTLAMAARDTTMALQELALAVELDPSDGPTRLQYGRALQMARRPQDAVDQLRAATSLEPYYADAHAALGEAYEATGKTEDAIAAYRAAQKHSTARSAVAAKAAARLSALRPGSP
jgi:tetratricopeptide (TPR) repeat protein